MPSDSIADPRAITRDLFSATIGSVACCYSGQPFDTIKVRMQTDPKIYSGVMSTTTQIMKNEGVAALWKGAVPTAAGMALENMMAFGVNEALKRAFPDEQKEAGGPPSLFRPFLMGAATGCCSALVLLTSEIVKIRQQSVVGTGQSTSEMMKKLVKQNGYRSLFVGLDAQIGRDATFYGFFFGSYELSCYLFKTHVPSMPEELNYFLSGGLAGMASWFFAMPMDVPKTNVQARDTSKVIGSYLPEFARIARERGLAGFYSGLLPTLVRAFPANAALFLGVETGKKLFDNFIWSA